jgi:hypothetical protein
MIKNTFLILAAVISFCGTAKASTIDVLLGNSLSFSTVSAKLTSNVDLTNTSILKLSGPSAVLSGGYSIPHYFTSPTGTLSHNLYLGVATGGSATFNLATNGDSFGLTWGTIDDYNSLILTGANGTSYTVTGAELLNYLATLPPSVSRTQANIDVIDPFSNIISAELVSTSNSFEAANFSRSKASAVPLPASAVLFGLAVVGLIMFGRRKQSII